MQTRAKPNYHWWVNMETWTFKQATLLLHGLDPNRYPALKPYVYHLPPEYLPLKKTYLVISQFPWRQLYPQYYFENQGVHPVAIIFIALQKRLPLPKRLRKLVIARFHQENQQKQHGLDVQATLLPYATDPKPSPPTIIQRRFGFTARERKNLLRSLGIVVRLLFSEEQGSPRYWYANHLNASQIAQTILEKAQQMGIPTQGLKSLDRKITEALTLLEAKNENEDQSER